MRNRGKVSHRGDAGFGAWGAKFARVLRLHFGEDLCKLGLEEPAMFKLPAFDPVGIAVMGFGVSAILAVAFVL